MDFCPDFLHAPIIFDVEHDYKHKNCIFIRFCCAASRQISGLFQWTNTGIFLKRVRGVWKFFKNRFLSNFLTQNHFWQDISHLHAVYLNFLYFHRLLRYPSVLVTGRGGGNGELLGTFGNKIIGNLLKMRVKFRNFSQFFPIFPASY